MDWHDTGLLLSARPHGEHGAVAMVLTAAHGRYPGLVAGGQSPARRAILQPGTRVAVHWRGRLPEHLGSYSLEAEHSLAAGLFNDPLRLAGLSAACAITDVVLPERAPYPAVYAGLLALLEVLPSPAWAEAYVSWELALLRELGFGLDFGQCAVSGRNDTLAYVSPRSGRAVSLSVGEPYRDRLLPLPGFLIGQGGGGTAAVCDGLALTGYFLEHYALAAIHQGRVHARERFITRYCQENRAAMPARST